MVDKVLFSSGQDSWSTPDCIWQWLKTNYGEVFDPCPLNPNYTVDGLKLNWTKESQGRTIYVNPPYSKGNMLAWMAKCYSEYLNGNKIVILIPARTDTKYFHKYLKHCQEIYFIEGRLHFGGMDNSAPFPSMICVFNPQMNNALPVMKFLSKDEL